ncbi:MAG: 50S ribosomal protein L28 [Candidatus Omnitrophica bacterium]|nr:50S ribosomal protein L28 [Candidatus Omnitrophota bacterium]
MSRKCSVCGKGAISGNTLSRRGKAKRDGGVGIKITSTTKRVFLPNLQKRKVLVNGKIKRVLVCTKCIKSGKLNFAGKASVTNN